MHNGSISSYIKKKISGNLDYEISHKEIIGKSDKGDEFDEIRKIRNSINYYGKDISTQEAMEVIARIKKLRDFVLSMPSLKVLY